MFSALYSVFKSALNTVHWWDIHVIVGCPVAHEHCGGISCKANETMKMATFHISEQMCTVMIQKWSHRLLSKNMS